MTVGVLVEGEFGGVMEREECLQRRRRGGRIMRESNRHGHFKVSLTWSFRKGVLFVTVNPKPCVIFVLLLQLLERVF